MSLFNVQTNATDAAMVIIPVPWDATTSYRPGTSRGPKAILEASSQVDLFDLELGSPTARGIHMLPISEELSQKNRDARLLAEKIISSGWEGDHASPDFLEETKRVNELCEDMVHSVEKTANELLDSGKKVGLVGGDHSTPLGAIRAAHHRNERFGILHIDAHHDLRRSYQGFRYSHASIMSNVLEQCPNARLVQVGIRDFSEEEFSIAKETDQIEVFYDIHLKESQFSGKPWIKTCEEIVGELPEKVWISFDIDGLDPRFCPNTGTPVPGGLTFSEANAIFAALVKSGREIVGFDLNEVSPNRDQNGDLSSEWDANVGARILHKLAGWLFRSVN